MSPPVFSKYARQGQLVVARTEDGSIARNNHGEPMAAVQAAPKAEQPPRLIQLDRLAHTVMDGVTVMELDPLETGKHARRVVLRPDFQGGPGAALSVRF